MVANCIVLLLEREKSKRVQRFLQQSTLKNIIISHRDAEKRLESRCIMKLGKTASLADSM